MTSTPESEPQFLAAVHLIGRAGAHDFALRYSDDEDPIVWLCIATFLVDEHGTPAREGRETWEAAAGHNPLDAALRLAERLVDGGECAHCHRPTIFHADVDPLLGEGQAGALVDTAFCNYQWDPELATFRRACEGES